VSPPTRPVTDTDAQHLRRARELAEGGHGAVAPNPLVGATVVRDGHLIGEGFHAELGGVHAEVAALADCRERGHDPAEATMYVTLEPCAHHGRQPPCTDAIVAAGIARVVIGSDDPTEKASGRGPGILRDEGVSVDFADGPEAAACRLLDQAFRKHARTGRPLVIHKAAVSLDGATAPPERGPRWISGPESRRLVHAWRAEATAIAVGIGTALADDPLLTAREVPVRRQPLRVIFDSAARLPPDSKLAASAGDSPVLVLCRPDAPADRLEALRARGVETAGVRSLEAGLDELGRRGLNSLLLEGGATLASAFLAAGELDELRLFIAPLLLGGSGPGLYASASGAAAGEPVRPLAVETETSGEDLLVRARLREW
jgi:diaminohydroxyphosphoribosylaminopyrimidine deaminase / 5-amino-6-(5-phosphoribosylamino)uracil reductase